MDVVLLALPKEHHGSLCGTVFKKWESKAENRFFLKNNSCWPGGVAVIGRRLAIRLLSCDAQHILGICRGEGSLFLHMDNMALT